MPRVARTFAAALLALASIASIASAQARPSRLSVLPGSVTVGEGVDIPPGGFLRVSLHDLSPGVAKDSTVAKETFEVAGKTPIYFELSYNPSVIEPSHLYGIGALITDSRGQALWETRVPIRVLTLGNQKKVQLVLRPSERPKPPPDPTSLAVECDGLRFHVDLNDSSATVVLQKSTFILPVTEALSGKRFSDGATTFAVSGSSAYFQGPGKAYRNCKVSAEPESEPKP